MGPRGTKQWFSKRFNKVESRCWRKPGSHRLLVALVSKESFYFHKSCLLVRLVVPVAKVKGLGQMAIITALDKTCCQGTLQHPLPWRVGPPLVSGIGPFPW